MKKLIATVAIVGASMFGTTTLAEAAPRNADRPSVSNVVGDSLLKAKSSLRRDGHTVTSNYKGKGACNSFRQVVTGQGKTWIGGINPHWSVRLTTTCED